MLVLVVMLPGRATADHARQFPTIDAVTGDAALELAF